ncbi:MAG: hypothetical protein F6K39_23515 [Okeania sp. SIO3B3]|nr:hypothetical protein [Okeania sp. SIO3B3]
MTNNENFLSLGRLDMVRKPMHPWTACFSFKGEDFYLNSSIIRETGDRKKQKQLYVTNLRNAIFSEVDNSIFRKLNFVILGVAKPSEILTDKGVAFNIW